jgi:hypothetical protein
LPDIPEVFQIDEELYVGGDFAFAHRPENEIRARNVPIGVIFKALFAGVVALDTEPRFSFSFPHADDPEAVSGGKWNILSSAARIEFAGPDVAIGECRCKWSLAPGGKQFRAAIFSRRGQIEEAVFRAAIDVYRVVNIRGKESPRERERLLMRLLELATN